MEEETKEEVKEVNILDEARQLNEDLKKNIADFKEVKAQQILSGNSDAPVEKEKPKEETAEEYSKRILNG